RVRAAPEAVLDAALLIGYVGAGGLGTPAGARGTLSIAGLCFGLGAFLCWGKIGRSAPDEVGAVTEMDMTMEPALAPVAGWERLGFDDVGHGPVELGQACPTCAWLGLS